MTKSALLLVYSIIFDYMSSNYTLYTLLDLSTWLARRGQLPRLTLLLLALLPSLSSCSSSDSYRGLGLQAAAAPKTAAELRAELRAQEQDSPGDYLQLTGTYRRNLIDQLVLEGDIRNSATLASFKDPVVEVEWRSKTNTVIDRQHYRVYELVRPHRTVHFKLKTAAPDEVASVSMGVNEAVAVE